jgi:hypothetical protein
MTSLLYFPFADMPPSLSAMRCDDRRVLYDRMELERDLVEAFAILALAAKSSIVIVAWGFSSCVGNDSGSPCRLIRCPFLPPLLANQLDLHSRHIIGNNTL